MQLFRSCWQMMWERVLRRCLQTPISMMSTLATESGVNYPHTPVLVNEVVENLKPQPGQRFVDLTFGAGGHTRALLDACPDITVFGLDRDPLAFNYAKQLSASTNKRVLAAWGRFSESLLRLSGLGCEPGTVDGVVMDLGASSMQMDSPSRGFGCSKDAPLDMRMSFNPISHSETDESSASGDETEIGPTAADVVNRLGPAHLARMLRVYGEERFARRIANAVAEHRATLGPIRSSAQLAELVASVGVLPVDRNNKNHVSHWSEDGEPLVELHRHAATRVFQALRIFVNDELNELCAGLEAAYRLLRPGGRVAVISFHSLEDRLVKRALAMTGTCGFGLAQRLADTSTMHTLPPLAASTVGEETRTLWRQIAGPLRPTLNEVQENKRSRSAKLRVAEKRQQTSDSSKSSVETA